MAASSITPPQFYITNPGPSHTKSQTLSAPNAPNRSGRGGRDRHSNFYELPGNLIVFDSLIFVQWIGHGFGHLGEERLAVLAATLIIIGVQIIFSSFLVSILGVRQQSSPATP